MDGRGGGDRTTGAVEGAQVVDFIKREKCQKRVIRPSEVHGGYTDDAKAQGRWNQSRSMSRLGVTAKGLLACDWFGQRNPPSIAAKFYHGPLRVGTGPI